MFAMPEKIQAVCHPLVQSMYVKHEFGGDDVLIIETKFASNSEDTDTYDSYMAELLFDLENLKEIAQERAGNIDRVDIRSLN